MTKSICLVATFFFFLLSLSGQTVVNDHEVADVKGGHFEMGGAYYCTLDVPNKYEDAFPIHRVYVSDFYIGTHEVTNSQYCNFLNSSGFSIEETLERIWLDSPYCYIKHKDNKYVIIKGYEDFPVNHISWSAADEYCRAMGGRLPTEAEWEFAARGGTLSKGFLYSGSDSIDDVGVVSNNHRKLCRVKSLQPNELGIYDMSGNVFEYCSDWYDPEYYSRSPERNPKGPEKPVKFVNEFPMNVLRGGSFNMPYNMAEPGYRRASYIENKKNGGHWIDGFRICFDK